MTDVTGTMISSFLPFPNILWWAHASMHNDVCFDKEEHFQKMSYRNRYYIPGSNGLIVLSIPLTQGRNQRTVMKDVQISNVERWQVQHWRTITSVYRRSPFFDFYEQSLEQLFTEPFHSLADFNMASVHWLKHQLKASFTETTTTEFVKEYHQATDIRNTLKPGIEQSTINTITYYQTFAERTGFMPNMSMLDLLFAEGPHAMKWIKDNKESILQWNKP